MRLVIGSALYVILLVILVVLTGLEAIFRGKRRSFKLFGWVCACAYIAVSDSLFFCFFLRVTNKVWVSAVTIMFVLAISVCHFMRFLSYLMRLNLRSRFHAMDPKWDQRHFLSNGTIEPLLLAELLSDQTQQESKLVLQLSWSNIMRVFSVTPTVFNTGDESKLI